MTREFQRELFAAWPERAAGATFLTSFTFHAPYFELRLLWQLLERDAHPVVVFVDRKEGYDGALASIAALGSAGRDYHLLAVDRGPFVFHPKVQLFAGAGTVLVGSGNLTPSGCGGNLEVFDCLSAVSEGQAVGQVREFFRELLRDPILRAHHDIRGHLLSLLPEHEDPHPTGDAVFLHSLHQPLHAQFEAAVLETAHSRALFAAPFHDADHETANRLWTLLGRPKAQVAAQPDAAPPRPPFSVEAGALADAGQDRSLHAKIVHAAGEETSLLVVGSANLTRAAWEGRNVEAIVVRQELRPTAFDAWLAEHPFRKATWQRALTVEQLADGLPQVPLEWAVLHGEILTVKLTLEGPVRFEIETGDRLAAIEMHPRTSELWDGRLPSELRRAAVVRASAAGFSPAAAVIAQVDRQLLRPREARIRDAISRMGEGPVDDETRRELLACLGDLFASVGARASTPPEKIMARSGASPLAHAVSIDKDPDDPVEEVESLVYGRSSHSRTLLGRMNHLLMIVDLVTGMNVPAPIDADQWRPEMLDRALRVTSPSQVEKLTDTNLDTSTAVEVPEPDDAPEPSEFDRVPPAVVEAALRLVDRLLPTLRARAESSREEGVLIYATLLRLLANIAVQCPSSQGAAVDATLSLLEESWAMPDWPRSEAGYWLTFASPPFPDLQATELASLLCVSLVDGRGRRALDVAKRVALGLAAVAVHAAQMPIESLHDRWGFPAGTSLGALRESVAAHRTRGELACDQLDSLWRLEHVWSALMQFEEERAVLEKKRARHVAVCSELVRRNERHKQSAAELVLVDAELATLDTKIAAAREVETAARAVAKATAPLSIGLSPESRVLPPVAFWEKTPPRRIAGGRRRLVPVRGTACSSCNMELRVLDAARLEDPRALVRCTHCNLLIAAGPPVGVFDG